MIASMLESELEIAGAENRRWQETQRVPGSIVHLYISTDYELKVLQQQQQRCGVLEARDFL